MDNNVGNVNNTSTETTNYLTTTTKALTSPTTSSSFNSATTTSAAAAAVLGTAAQTQLIATISTASSTNSFWKNSNRIVPGRPSPKRINTIAAGSETSSGSGMMATFRDYQKSVSDAWDTGDDEFCIISNAATQQLQSLDKNSDETVTKTGKFFFILF